LLFTNVSMVIKPKIPCMGSICNLEDYLCVQTFYLILKDMKLLEASFYENWMSIVRIII